MPLTSKDNGRELQPGDYVKVPWVVARVFPDVDVAMVMRQGGTGAQSVSPQTVTVRLGHSKTALKIIPANDTLRDGARCLIIWRVGQVYPSSGTVLVQRDGIGGSPEQPTTILATAGVLASDCEYVPPEDVKPPKPKPLFKNPLEPVVPDLEPDALPFIFDVGEYAWPADGYGPAVPEGAPVVTILEPAFAVLGSPSFTLRVHGSGFTPEAVILWNGSPEPTTVVSPIEVTTAVNMATAQVALTIPVAVTTTAGVSNTLPFDLLPAGTPQSTDPDPPCG